MKTTSGFIVETKAGNRGRTRNSDHYINGKVVVYLEDQAFKPILDDSGKQKQILADRKNLKIIGYSD